MKTKQKSKAKGERTILVVLSDTHAGFSLALMNPEVLLFDEDENGDPIYVGGATANQLFTIQSIGNEDYPFVSKIRGITTTDPNKYVTLPTGELTDTSIIGNVRVIPEENQVDIGLFGCVGPDLEGEVPETDYQGEISNILLYYFSIDNFPGT